MTKTRKTNQVASVDAEQMFNDPSDIYNRIANWVLAGFENKAVRLSAADQKKLLGFNAGKGLLNVELEDGKWVIRNYVKVCFGTDIGVNGCFNLATGERLY